MGVGIEGSEQGGPCAGDILDALAVSAQPGPLGAAVVETLAPVWSRGCDQVSPGLSGGSTPSSRLCATRPGPTWAGGALILPAAGPNHVPSSPQSEPPERQEGPDPEGAAGAAASDHPAALLPAALPILRPLLRVRALQRTVHGGAHPQQGREAGSRISVPQPLFSPSSLPLCPIPASLNTYYVLSWDVVTCSFIGSSLDLLSKILGPPAMGIGAYAVVGRRHRGSCQGWWWVWACHTLQVTCTFLSSSLDYPHFLQEALEVQRGWAV